MGKNTLIAVAITFILFSTSAYSQSKFYDLNDCINIAVRENYDIKNYEARIKGAGADLTNAFGNYFPSINLGGGYQRILNPDQAYSGPYGITVPAQSPNIYSMSATAQLGIFDGFSREANYDRAEQSLDASEKEYLHAIESVKLQIYNYYINVIRNKQLVKIRRENLALGRQELERMQAQFDAGVVAINAVYSQEADLGSREIELINAENELDKSKTQLLAVMGLDPSQQAEFSEESLDTDISDEEIQQFRETIGSMNAAIDKALENRYDYSSTKSRIDAAESSVRMAQSSYMPNLNADGGWNWSNTKFNDFSERGRSYVGLSLRVPVFNNFSVNNRIQSAKVQLTQQEINQKTLEQNIKTDIRNSILNLEAAVKQIEVSERSVKSAEENYKSAKERFDIGALNITDLTAANTQLITAKINQINSKYNYINAQYQALYSIGKLTD